MMDPALPITATLEVRDRCLCLHLQRAARRVARLFDDALRPFGVTNGQYSLLMSLNRPQPPRPGDLVPLLGMDGTTLTAALKVLERRGLTLSSADPDDGRARRITLTDAGREVLKAALPVWRLTHDRLDASLTCTDPQSLRAALRDIA